MIKNFIALVKKIVKEYDQESDDGYVLEVDLEYSKRPQDFYSDLQFLPERMKINKCNKLVCNLYDKKYYVVHIKALKQALNHGLVLKRVHRIITFNQKAWSKPYIYIKIRLKTKSKNGFEKDSLI